MRELVALDLPPGPGWVDELRRAWDAGDAVLPLDRRLPGPARRAVMEAAHPTVVVDRTGRHRLPDGEPVEDGDALVVATSGTTGVPKAVILTHDAVRASAEATSRRLAVDPTTDTWLACLPLAHVGGLSVVTRALITGTPLIVHDGFDADAVIRAARAGATLVSLVPTALARVDPALFRTVVVGGSRPPRDRPPNVVATYGMTETGSGVVYDGVPLDGVEVRIAADGEIHLRGPMLTRGYRDGTDPRTGDGWLPTGDLGAWVGGRLVVRGRRGDLIITGGENVWPEPVEGALRTHPKVADAAVAGVEDPEWGQRVVAWIVPTDPADPPRLAELRDWVSARLPRFCAPREVRVTTALPRTPLGKLRRSALVDGTPSADGTPRSA